MSGRNWTPYDIEVILHHYCSNARFDREDAPAYGPSRDAIIEAGVLEWRDGIPKPTEMGEHFVEMLLSTPLPRKRWIDPRDGKDVMRERWAFESSTTSPAEGG